MKKLVILAIVTSALTAKAGLFDFFDYTKFFEAAIMFAEGLNENLEKVRVKQQEVVDIKEQWEMACDMTQTINPTLVEFSKFLTTYKLNQNFCAPLTTAIKLQSDILMHCKDYYSKPVPENAEYLVGKFTVSILQTKMIMTKCFPVLSNIQLPTLPGGN